MDMGGHGLEMDREGGEVGHVIQPRDHRSLDSWINKGARQSDMDFRLN